MWGDPSIHFRPVFTAGAGGGAACCAFIGSPPSCTAMLECEALHRHTCALPVFIRLWVTYPPQLGHPVCPGCPSSLQPYGFKLTGGQSLTLWLPPPPHKPPPPLVLLEWITHRNFLETSILSSDLITYSLLRWMLLSQKASAQAKGRDVRALYCAFLGHCYVRKGKAFLLLNKTEMHTKVEGASGGEKTGMILS